MGNTPGLCYPCVVLPVDIVAMANVPLSFESLFWLPHQHANGAHVMAMDEALLDWCRDLASSTLIVRTYTWNHPTLSLGVHQPDKSSQAAYEHYVQTDPTLNVVQRPTGGRAILHGTDVSYAFITNHPGIMAMPLSESYCVFMTWVHDALERCGVSVQCDADASNTRYAKSALCFETHTSHDLISTDGQKITGASQLRRHHGLLQHGAAFLAPFNVDAPTFETTLREILQADPQLKNPPWQTLCLDDDASLHARVTELTQQTQADADRRLAKLSTTSGSQRVPDSLCSTVNASDSDIGVSR